jgi:hypothetical protein
MAQKFTVPVTIKNLSSAGSDGITVFLDQETYARLKIEAGGRFVWGDGASAGDTNLYRDGANVLRTDDSFKTPVLFVDNIEIDTTSASVGNVLKFDGTKFSPGIASTVGSIDDLSDVAITAAVDGQILVFNGTNWVNTTLPTNEPIGHENKDDSVISFNEGTRTFSISPVLASYTIWCTGKRFVKTGTETVVIPDTSGIYYIYFDSSGVLSYRTDYFAWDEDTPTAYVYWNATDNKAYFFADERHGVTLDWATHEYLHRTRGAAIANGFGINNYTTTGDGSSDAHAKFDLANGTFFDEDLQVDIVHSETPTPNTWEQTLQGYAEIPVFYKLGSDGHWVKDAATEFAFKQGATPRPTYNLNSGGTWSTPEVTNSYYLISWIVATNNLNEPVLAIMGQGNYSSLGNAEAATWEQLDLTGLPIFEFRPLHKVIYRGYNIYTNSVNARIHAVTDIRQIMSTAGSVPSTPVSDHGSLTGLADDDHTQYLTDARHDALDHTTAMGSVVLDDISDVSASTPSSGDFLKWNGTAWVNDAINLGTDTTGNYVVDIVAGTGVTITHTPGEGSSPTVAIGQNVSTSASVAFSNVTADLIGNVTGTISNISNHSIDELLDVSTTLAVNGDFLKFNGSSWVSASIPAINALDDIGDVVISSPTIGQILSYNGSIWINQDNSTAATDIDGGTTPADIYEAEITNRIEVVYDGGTL